MPTMPPDTPEDIRDAAATARRLAAQPKRTPREEADLNQARLSIAFFACRREGVPATWENLAYVLGRHAETIEPMYRQMLLGDRKDADDARREARRKDAARRRSSESGPSFWGGSRQP